MTLQEYIKSDIGMHRLVVLKAFGKDSDEYLLFRWVIGETKGFDRISYKRKSKADSNFRDVILRNLEGGDPLFEAYLEYRLMYFIWDSSFVRLSQIMKDVGPELDEIIEQLDYCITDWESLWVAMVGTLENANKEEVEEHLNYLQSRGWLKYEEANDGALYKITEFKNPDKYEYVLPRGKKE